MKTLLIGFGNPDRQDDGLAWHILSGAARKLGLEAPEHWEDDLPVAQDLELRFYLQLTPELAEIVSGFERVCFIDAHTGQIPDALRLAALEPAFQASPFTHHLTPETLLSLARALYGSVPQAALLSARGYQFGFAQELSPAARALLPAAIDLAVKFVQTA